MKIHENFHVKGIFHDDKSKRMKVYTRIYLVSTFLRFVELCSARNQCIYFFCFYLFLIQNIQEDNSKIKKVTVCQNLSYIQS